MITPDNQPQVQDRPASIKDKVFNRRSFLQLMLGLTASVSYTLNAKASMPATHSAVGQEYEGFLHKVETVAAARADLDLSFVANDLVPSGSVLFDQRNNTHHEISAAGAEKIFDEPEPQLIQKSEREYNQNGEIILYRDYELEYQGQRFIVSVRTLNSENYPDTLAHYFNSSKTPISVNRQVSMITFNSQAAESGGLDKVTLYCLESYFPDDAEAIDIALNEEFYETVSEDNQVIKKLKEDWTVCQFAQAFNPRTIACLSSSGGITTFNQIGEEMIKNASVILSNKAGGGVAAAYDPIDDFFSDRGSVYAPSARTSTKASMEAMAAALAHELCGHGTAKVGNPNIATSWLYFSNGRDQLSESQADMCETSFWTELGNAREAEYRYEIPLQQVFSVNNETKMYSFSGYTPLLFATLLLPYSDQLSVAIAGSESSISSEQLIDLSMLNRLHKQYMDMRNKMITSLTPEWYFNWRKTFLNSETFANHSPRMLLAHHDVYAPLIYAQYIAGRRDPLEDKDFFMAEVLEKTIDDSFQARIQLLTRTFLNKGENMVPYFSEVFREACGVIASVEDEYNSAIILTPPEAGQTIEVERKVDPVYLSENIETIDEYYYRNFYPYYSIEKLPESPEGTTYILSKLTEDSDFLVTIMTPVYEGVFIRDYVTTILKKGESLSVSPQQSIIICVLDLRKDQVSDDLANRQKIVYQIKANKSASVSVPPEESKKKLNLPFIPNE